MPTPPATAHLAGCDGPDPPGSNQARASPCARTEQAFSSGSSPVIAGSSLWQDSLAGRGNSRLARREVLGREVIGRDPLRHTHAPGVQDELLHLGPVDGGKPDAHPLITQIGL